MALSGSSKHDSHRERERERDRNSAALSEREEKQSTCFKPFRSISDSGESIDWSGRSDLVRVIDGKKEEEDVRLGREARKEGSSADDQRNWLPVAFCWKFFFYLSFNEEIGGGRDRKERGGVVYLVDLFSENVTPPRVDIISRCWLYRREREELFIVLTRANIDSSPKLFHFVQQPNKDRHTDNDK